MTRDIHEWHKQAHCFVDAQKMELNFAQLGPFWRMKLGQFLHELNRLSTQ